MKRNLLHNSKGRAYRIINFCILLLYILLLPQQSAALSKDQLNALKSGARYLNTDVCGSGSSSASSGGNSSPQSQGGGLYMVGDSITVRSQSDLASNFKDRGYQSAINGSVSRSITQPGITENYKTSGLKAVEDDKDKIKDANVIVVALGTNQDADFEQSIKDLIRKIDGYNSSAQIYWVNIFSPAVTNRVQLNKVIEKVSNSEDYQFKIIDMTGANIPMDGDNLHPKIPQGVTKFANAVANGIGQPSRVQQPNTGSSSSSSCCSSNSSSAGGAGNVNIASIVRKYDLQSAMVQTIGGDTVTEFHSNQPPSTPASTMKLIIADTLLRSGEDLNKSVAVTRELYYNGGNDLGASSTTLANALEQTLKVSSNVGANVMIKDLGGVDAFTNKAQSFGYSHTTVKGYYDPSNDGKNTSTISDQVEAMGHIFRKQGNGYDIAQKALENAAQSTTENHYGVAADAIKWAGTTTVAGNVAKIKAGGNDFIVGLYINKSMADPDAISGVKNGSADLAQAAASSSGAPDSGGSAALCCAAPSGTIDLVGKDNGEKVWNFFIGKGLSNVQAAGIMGNLQIESGFETTIYFGGNHNPDPSKVGDNAWGLGQWKRSTSYVLDVQKEAIKDKEPGADGDITALSTQLAIMWWQVKNVSPTGTRDMLEGLKKINDLGAAVHYWQQYFEGSLGQGDSDRLTAAQGWTTHSPSSGGAPTIDTSSSSCSSAPSDKAAAIVQTALKLSWPDASHGTTPTSAYQKAYDQYNSNGPGIADCGGFVATVMRASGADPKYPPGGTGAQEDYVRNSGKYEVVDKVNNIKDLQPGDILIVNSSSGTGALGHTFIFVGPQSPNNYDAASASLGTRAANLGKAILSDGRGFYLRARMK
jgi:hypothetical protein